MREWWDRVGDAGWTAPHFSLEWGGRGYSRRSLGTVYKAFRAAGAVAPPGGLGMMMAAPTILTHGTPEQIERHVTPIYNGSPGVVPALQRARQRLRPRRAHHPRHARRRPLDHLRARRCGARRRWSPTGACSSPAPTSTCPSTRASRGSRSTLDQPGVTIRPLREMTGRALFNEVFFDDAVVDDADLIGGLNNGWAVANTTLFFERSGIGSGSGGGGFPPPGTKEGYLDQRAGDVATHARRPGQPRRHRRRALHARARARPHRRPDAAPEAGAAALADAHRRAERRSA